MFVDVTCACSRTCRFNSNMMATVRSLATKRCCASFVDVSTDFHHFYVERLAPVPLTAVSSQMRGRATQLLGDTTRPALQPRSVDPPRNRTNPSRFVRPPRHWRVGERRAVADRWSVRQCERHEGWALSSAQSLTSMSAPLVTSTMARPPSRPPSPRCDGPCLNEATRLSHGRSVVVGAGRGAGRRCCRLRPN